VLETFEGGHVVEDEYEVEVSELREDGREEYHKQESGIDGQREQQLPPFDGLLIGGQVPKYCVDNRGKHCHKIEVQRSQGIEQQKEEELSVPEAHTIVYPWTMVIHIQNASIAGRTVMTSIRLEHIAHQAIALAFGIWVAHVEALELKSHTYPINRHAAWVGQDRLKERPHQQHHKVMK
jgi:hypothetical protein